MQRSLAAASIDCARLLARLALLHEDAQYTQHSALQATDLEDQSARFQVWAGNLGAFQRLPASASLDYRLRGSPKIATQILELLQDLEATCGDVQAIALGERPNRRVDPESDGIDGEEEDKSGETDDESDRMDDESDEQEQDLSEAEELFESVKDTIASLFRLAVVIRNSSPRDRYARALGGNNPFLEDFDIAHVGQKFPKLNVDSNVWLRDRIGKAIAQRRQYLRYAREHRYKLGKEPIELWKPAVEFPKTFLQAQSQAARTNNSKPVTTLADTTASTLFLQETPQIEVDFRDNQSQTSFGFSKGGEENQHKVQLPRLSEVAKGQSSFECPFCWTIQSIRRESAWRKHALADLRPYLCTFGDCDVKLFADRKTWFEHELQTHRTKWRCHCCNHDDFPVKEALNNHMHHKHIQFGVEQLEVLVDAGRRPNTFFKASDCPFCDDWDVYLREKEHPPLPPQGSVAVDMIEFRRHVASHMQDLALFAIPRGYLEGDDDADSTASARAAGARNDTGSVVGSRIALSVDSYDTEPHVEPPRNDADIESYARAINESMVLPSPAFEEQLINILPALCEQELEDLKKRCGLAQKIGEMSDLRLQTLAKASCSGQLEAGTQWIDSWHTYPVGSPTWLSIFSNIMLSRSYSPDNLAKVVLGRFEPDLKPYLLGFGFRSWFVDCLGDVLAGGRAQAAGHTPEDMVLQDISLLRAKFTALDHDDETCRSVLRLYLMASNRHLRKVFRLYKKLHPGEDLIVQLVDLIMGNDDVQPWGLDPDMIRTFVEQLVKDVASRALDPVTRDANNLHAALNFSNVVDKSLLSQRDVWDEVALQFTHLHWNKYHLVAVKSAFEDLHGVAVETYIDTMCNYCESAEQLAAFLKALVAVETEEPILGSGRTHEPDVEPSSIASAPYLPMVDFTHVSKDVGLALPVLSGDPAIMYPVSRNLRFQQAAWTLVVIKRWWRLHKRTKLLKELLGSINQGHLASDGPAWLPSLSRYPIFKDCPDFLDAVRPHLQLEGYETGEMILARGECASWIGWLITGTTWYIATYNHNNERRSWVTKETECTIGLVDSLFDLQSLIEHRTVTPCLLATLPKDIFNKLVQSSPGVAQHIAVKDFGASFSLTRECLRIETEFGHPWWHIFHTLPSSAIDRSELVARILQSSPDPQIVTSLPCTIEDLVYTPLDLVADIDDMDTAKVLLEHGAKVSSRTIKVLLRNENLDFIDLILNRPGAAEAANELLRSDNKEDVAKLQKLLKEMQGSVPVNLAVEKDYNVALVEPRDISEYENEPGDEDEDEPDDFNVQGDVPFSRDDFAAAIEHCFNKGDTETECTSRVGQFLQAFSDKPAASAFLNSDPVNHDDGCSLLTGAIKHDCLDLLVILLDYGIDTDAADNNGLFPLDHAMSSTERRIERCTLLLDHGATKSSQDRRAELAQVKEQIRIAKKYGGQWPEILQSAATSEESLALVRIILEEAEHPRLTANILFSSGQTALDVAIAHKSTDLVLLLLQHDAWPAEDSALLAAESNADLDLQIIEALRKHLSTAFTRSTTTQTVGAKVQEDDRYEMKDIDTQIERTTPNQYDDQHVEERVDGSKAEHELALAETECENIEHTATYADTTPDMTGQSPITEVAEDITQVAVDEREEIAINKEVEIS